MEFNPMSLKEKRFLVTGAASGLGKAASILLSRLGARLILVDINEPGLRDTATLCVSDTALLPLDLTDTKSIKQAIVEAAEKYGKLNGLVHLAGRSYVAPLKSMNIKTTEDVFALNAMAALELVKAFIHRNVCSEDGNSIVLISSVYGHVGSAANVGYAMSKSALHGITKSLAIELAPKKIRVNCIAPGFIQTNMLDGISASFDPEYHSRISGLHPLGLGNASDIANSVAFLLSDMSSWITGSIMNVDGGFTAQ